MSNTVSAVLRLKESVGANCPTNCDGYTIHHRGYEVVLTFPRNEKGVNDEQIISKIRALANIYYDQYGSTDRGNFIDLYDDLTDYNYYIDMADRENNSASQDSASLEEDVEDMMDYLEQQQDEENIHKQIQRQQEEQEQYDNNDDLYIGVNEYVTEMETRYGANIPSEKNWIIDDQMKSAFPYQVTLYAVKSALDFMMVQYTFDTNANIFTVYMVQKDTTSNIFKVDQNVYYKIIVRYATPFYAVVKFQRFNILEFDMVHYRTQLIIIKQKITGQQIRA